jgi:hypothetical protein
MEKNMMVEIKKKLVAYLLEVKKISFKTLLSNIRKIYL